jgi:glycosyltransferase involved in cell wall biosynthesis
MEKQLLNLTKGLLDRGHRVTVIARTCEVAEHELLRVHRLPVPRRPFAIAYPIFMAVGTWSVWRHKDGLVHATGAIVLNKADVITVHLCHRALARIPGVLRSRRESPLWRTHARVAGWMARAAERWAYRPSRVRRVVAVSRGGLDELLEVFPELRNAAVAIPNGVDDTRLSEPALNPGLGQISSSPDELTALFVGSEWEGKGLRYAIDALAQAPGWRLVVVGEGDRRRYESLASDVGVQERVDFLGWRADVRDLYTHADAFVLPSSYETFSLVTFEAAAAGLPLLVTRVQGVSELMEDGVTGWYIAQDREDIARRLQMLVDDDRRARLGESARVAARPFTWDRMIQAYETVYAELTS